MQNSPKEKVIVGVCTRERPELLKRCLQSLINLPVSDAFDAFIVVVENHVSPNQKVLVESLASVSPHPILYHHEPQIGIPFARNLIVDKALSLSANWLAFIDDDETADPDWLKALYQAAYRWRADVIQGRVIYDYPAEDRWASLQEKNGEAKSLSDGRPLRTAATNNVLFSSHLVSSDGFNLRFDTQLKYTGGSDTDFFNRSHINGARFVYTTSAVVHEVVPIDRCSFGYLFERQARIRATGFFIDKKNLGLKIALTKHIRRLLQFFIQAFFYFLAAICYCLIKPRKAKFYYFRGVMKLANCYGALRGFFGKLLNPYQNTQGY